MLELMVRSGMRVGEVLKPIPADVEERKAIIRDTKSGKEAEAALLLQKVADRLGKYIRENKIEHEARIFPICYAAARLVVKKPEMCSAFISEIMICSENCRKHSFGSGGDNRDVLPRLYQKQSHTEFIVA